MCLDLPIFQSLDDEQKAVYAMGLDGRFLIEGPPGTGKSVMALHRAANFARNNREVTLLMYNRPLMLWTKAALGQALKASRCTTEQQKLVTPNTVDAWFPAWYERVFGVRPPTRKNPAELGRKMLTKYDGTCALCKKPTAKDRDFAITIKGKEGFRAAHESCIDGLLEKEGYEGPDLGPKLITHAQARIESALKKHGQHLDLIVDEGQDLSNSFYRIMEPFCRSFTVYADEAQVITDAESRSLTRDIAAILRVEDKNKKRLGVNYRNRAEVAALAAQFRPRNDQPARAQKTQCTEQPALIRFDNMAKLADHLRTLHRNFGQKTIGVFFRYKSSVDKLGKALDGETWVQVYRSGEKARYDLCAQGAFIGTRNVAKGLEFDIVILADLQDWPATPTGIDDGMFYVIISRSRDVLQIAYTGRDQPQILGNDRYRSRLTELKRRDGR